MPVAEVFDAGVLDVGAGHRLVYEQVGAPAGRPVVYLHGGPGAGCTPAVRRLFDGATHRAVLFDQRACGRSTPDAADEGVDWATIDMDRHVGDIERLRVHLGIERWTVTGFSWGSVLGLAYAQRHPDRVSAVVLGAVSTGTRADIDWITVQVGRFLPVEWEAFRAHVPESLRHVRLVDAYHRLLADVDASVREAAASAWCRWEAAHVGVATGAGPDRRYEDARFRLRFARQVTHCWRHDSWLGDDQIVRGAHRLAGIPGRLVHGRLDLSSPIDAAWRLHRAWPGSELQIVEGEGHGGSSMAQLVARALDDLA